MEEKKLDLVPVISGDGHYVIKDYDNVLNVVKDYTETALKETEVVNDECSFKLAKNTRTDIRKHKDAITQARLNINALLLGDFNEQLKALETLLDATDKAIKEKVDAYSKEVKGDSGKPKVITLVIKSYDAKIINKIIAYTGKLNANVSVEVK